MPHSRRTVLRRGAGIVGLGAVGTLAGCRESNDSDPIYPNWLHAPGTLAERIDHYSFRVTDYATIRDDATHFDDSDIDQFEHLTRGFPFKMMDLAFTDVAWHLDSDLCEVVRGEFSLADATAALESSGFRAVDEYEGYDLFRNDTTSGVAVRDGTAVAIRDPEPTAKLERIIDTNAGNVPRYAEDGDFETLVEHLGTGTVVTGSTNESLAETDATVGKFAGVVATGAAYTVTGPETTLRHVKVFETVDAVDLPAVETWAESQFGAGAEPTREGRSVVVTRRIDTANVVTAGYISQFATFLTALRETTGMLTVRAPATSANLGSGFDVFGVALDSPADIVRVEKAPETSITVTGVGSQYIPEDPDKNTVGAVAEALDAPAHIQIDKGVRPASGLGSSAASAAAAAVGLNELYDRGHTREELVPIAAKGEAVVSGDAHDDNVAPSIMGGFTIATDHGVTTVDASISLVACLPDIVVSTRDARRVVPETARVEQLVETIGWAATLTAGMFRDDPELVGEGMNDTVVTPARADLIQGYDEVTEAAREAGATGVTISGAGPTVIAACQEADQRAVGAAMMDAFTDVGVDSKVYQTEIGDGATIY